MKRIFGSLRRSGPKQDAAPNYKDEAPEGVIIKEVNAFCGSGGGSSDDATEGSDYVRLPAIVENAESSPGAAKAAALRIRKILSSDTPLSKSYVQHNAIMLIRILSDNPGHTFTRNIDAKFVSTIRSLLRNSKDESVQILLRETLEILEAGRSWDEDFSGLLQMWKKEKGRSQKGDKLSPTSSQSPPGIGLHPHLQTAYPIQFTSSTLPPPGEVSARISEAQNSARLLLQLLDSTHPAEVQGHELIREFSDRCRTSSRTIQAYIESTNPAPDEGTLVALIETNDELSVSLSKYSHSILDARKGHGNNANINNSSNSHNNDSNTNVNTNTNTNTTPSTSASASGTGTSNSPARASVSAAPGPSSASASASASASGSHTPEFLIPSAVPAPLLPRRNTSQQSREASHYSGSPNRTHEYDTGSAASTSGKSRAASGVGVGVRPPPSASDDATVAGTSESGRYHYNPEDFQIPNPFAGPGPPGSGEDHT